MAQRDPSTPYANHELGALKSALVRAFALDHEPRFGELLDTIERHHSPLNCRDVAAELHRAE
jgi:hypothetical protein